MAESGLSPGLRPETYGLDLEAGAIRTIVALGDSIAYGWGVGYEQSFPSRLQRRLNQGVGRTPWRVINSGIPGDTSVMGCLRFAQDVTVFKPEIVLIGFGINDAMLRRTRFDAQRERIWRARGSLWRRLPYIVRARTTASWDSVTDDVQRRDAPRVSEEMFLAALGELVSRAREEGAETFLMTPVPALPMAADERQHALWRRYGEMVRQIARDADAGCANLDALIRECGSRAYAADGVHLTSVGYAWIAERTYEQLGGKL